MDKFQAAFEVLYLLASADGVDPAEINVIGDFMQANYGNIYFDLKATINSIESMTPPGKAEEFGRAALAFKNLSSAQDRNTLLDFALKLIAADGWITNTEKQLFWILGNTWNIDINKFLASIQLR
jgi:uncharacterized tellurite resistance protein B-like protein